MKTILAALALTLAAAPALAQSSEPKEYLTARASYADLDLATAKGRMVLERRIQIAVNRVCPMPDNRELDRVETRNACRANMTAIAQQQLAQVYRHERTAQASVDLLATR